MTPWPSSWCLLEERKIDDVLVVDRAGCAVGLVDIQDLPRFKVM